MVSYVPISNAVYHLWQPQYINRSNHAFKPLEVEVSEFCREVIQARIQDQLADPGRILSDIKTVKAGDLGEEVEGYLAGFPCQARKSQQLIS